MKLALLQSGKTYEEIKAELGGEDVGVTSVQEVSSKYLH